MRVTVRDDGLLDAVLLAPAPSTAPAAGDEPSRALAALVQAGGGDRELATAHTTAALSGALALLGGRLARGRALADELARAERRFNVAWRAATPPGALRVDVSVSSLVARAQVRRSSVDLAAERLSVRQQCTMTLLVRDVSAYPGGAVDVSVQTRLGAVDAGDATRTLAAHAVELMRRGEPQRVLALCDALAALVGAAPHAQQQQQ